MYLHFTYMPSWLAQEEFNLPLLCRNLEGDLSWNSLAFFLLPCLKNVTCYSALPVRVINKQLQYFCSESKWSLLHSAAVSEPPRLIAVDAAAGTCGSRTVLQHRRNRRLSAHALLILNATLDLSMSSVSTGYDRRFPGDQILSDSSLIGHTFNGCFFWALYSVIALFLPSVSTLESCLIGTTLLLRRTLYGTRKI